MDKISHVFISLYLAGTGTQFPFPRAELGLPLPLPLPPLAPLPVPLARLAARWKGLVIGRSPGALSGLLSEPEPRRFSLPSSKGSSPNGMRRLVALSINSEP